MAQTSGNPDGTTFRSHRVLPYQPQAVLARLGAQVIADAAEQGDEPDEGRSPCRLALRAIPIGSPLQDCQRISLLPCVGTDSGRNVKVVASQEADWRNRRKTG